VRYPPHIGWPLGVVEEAGLLRSGSRFAGPEHDDFRADRRAVVEIDDILVRQADAAGRNVGADGPGFIGAVDAVKRVFVAAQMRAPLCPSARRSV
jgi:hypothetical protein